MIGFEEKPADPKTIPGDPEHCLVNMGVYIVRHREPGRELCHDARPPGFAATTSARTSSRAWSSDGDVYAYPFRDPETARAAATGATSARSTATTTRTMDLVSRNPQFNLYDRDWPFRAWQPPVPPAKAVHGFTEDEPLPGMLANTIIGGGSMISGGRVERSILGHSCRVNSFSRVTESILMDDVQIGRYAELRRCIVDKDVVVPDGMRIGCDPSGTPRASRSRRRASS